MPAKKPAKSVKKAVKAPTKKMKAACGMKSCK